MKKIVSTLLIICNILILNGCSGQNNENFDTVIFYSPHADDEVLSMGASILQAKKAKKEVVVVLLSQGLASSAFHTINNKLSHNNLPPITLEQFGKARVKEFKESVKQLGVNEDHVYVYNLPDGEFSTDKLMMVMEEFAENFPNAQHHAMTYKDPHTDHAKTGQALMELLENKKIESAIYHVPIQESDNIQYEEKDKVPFFSRKEYRKALDAYGIWSPEEGFYSIGKDSVSSYFEVAEDELSSWWHE